MEQITEKKILIARAVRDLIVEKGVADFPVEEIAKKAGIGKGTVYLYFDNKEEIFIYTIIFYLEEFVDLLENELKEIVDPSKKLRFILRFHADYIKKMHFFWETIFGALTRKDPRKWGMEKFFSLRRRIISIIQSVVEEGIEKGVFREDLSREEVSMVIFMLFRSIGSFLGFEKEVREDPEKLEKFLATLEEVLLNGISSDN